MPDFPFTHTRDADPDQQHPKPPEPVEGEGVITGTPPDHYVHLANGAVIEGHAGGTHCDTGNGLVPIVAVYPKG